MGTNSLSSGNQPRYYHKKIGRQKKKKASKNLNQDGLRTVDVDVRCQMSVEE